MQEDLLEKHITTKHGVKGNVRYITISDNVPEHWDSIIDIGKSNYQWYAYIFHDKDKDTEKHLHILLYDEGGTTLKSHCARFASVVPSNFICKVISPRSMARYLIHRDSPEKFQYDEKLVFTNSLDKFRSFLLEVQSDCTSEYEDMKLVFSGRLSPEDFLDKYRGEFYKMPFYQKLNLYAKLLKGF